MRDSKKLISVYFCRIYSALMSLILVPYIIKIIGYEAYGLVGFFVVLQACLNILEAGVGGVLVRQLINNQVCREAYQNILRVFYKLLVLFIIISLIVMLLGWIFAQKYSYLWLNSDLEHSVTIECVFIMFCIFAIKYLQCPYRSILLSNESQITISFLTVIHVTISQPIALFYLVLFDGSVIDFFRIQLVGMFVLTLLIFYFGERSKKKKFNSLCFGNGQQPKINLRDMLFFSLQLSTLSILWIIVNQSDKLTLTKFMPLSEYAYYSVALTVAAILSVISEPVNQILLPRMARLQLENKQYEFGSLLSRYFVYLIIILIPLDIFIFFYGKELIFIWSNDVVLSKNTSIYLPWLFIGNTFSVFSNFCFLILYSVGQLKKHTVVYFIFCLIVIPLNILIAINYLGIGVVYFYAISTGLLFILWTGYNFRVWFDNGGTFLCRTILPIIIISTLYFYFSSDFFVNLENRLFAFIVLLIKGFGCVLLSYFYVIVFDKVKLKGFKG